MTFLLIAAAIAVLLIVPWEIALVALGDPRYPWSARAQTYVPQCTSGGPRPSGTPHPSGLSAHARVRQLGESLRFNVDRTFLSQHECEQQHEKWRSDRPGKTEK
jgi:hypothetical protein